MSEATVENPGVPVVLKSLVDQSYNLARANRPILISDPHDQGNKYLDPSLQALIRMAKATGVSLSEDQFKNAMVTGKERAEAEIAAEKKQTLDINTRHQQLIEEYDQLVRDFLIKGHI